MVVLETAAISGGWVALYLAIKKAVENGAVAKMPEVKQIAAISVGAVNGSRMLDLCYEEDSAAEFDLNLVFKENSEIIEIQGTAESKSVPMDHLNQYLDLAWKGTSEIMEIQKEAIA